MKKRKPKISFPLIAISIIILVAVSFVLIFSTDISDSLGFITETQVWKLSLGAGHYTTCKVNSELILKNVDGTTYNAGSQSFSKLFTFQDILNRQTAQKISSFNQNLRVYCDPIKTSTGTIVTNEQLYITGGAIQNNVVAYNSVGTEILIKSEQTAISGASTSNLAGSVRSIPSSFVNAIDIDNKLDVGDGDYQAWVKVKTTGTVIFKNNYGQQFTIIIPADGLNMGYLARIVKPLPVGTTAPVGTTVYIKSVTPSTIDFATNVRYLVTVVGQLDNWTSTEGYPIMTMKDSRTSVVSKLPMTNISNLDGDKYTEFTLQYVFNKDTFNVGSYTFEMTSALGSDGKPVRKDSSGYPITSVRGFIVYDTSVSGTTNTGGTEQISEFIAGKLIFSFKSIFEGEESSGTIPKSISDSLFTVTAKPLEIASSDTRLGKLFTERVEVLLKFDSPYAGMVIANPVNMKYTGLVTVGSLTLPIPLTDLNPKIINQKDSNGFIHLSSFELSGDSIQKILCDPASTGVCRVQPSDDPQQIIITVDVSGDFVLVDTIGKKYSGFIKNAKYVENLIFLNAGSPSSPEPDCSGLVGEAQLQCGTPQEPYCGSSGCLYPDEEQNVIDQITCAFTGSCTTSYKEENTSTGTVGGCSSTSSCTQQTGQQTEQPTTTQNGFPQINLTQDMIQLLFIFGILLLVVIIIVAIVRSRRR